MKISLIKYFPAQITSAQDCSGGSGSFPKEGQERGWRGAAPVGANKLLCLLGCSAVGTLFPVTVTLPGDARGHCIPAMPLTPCPWRCSPSHRNTHTVQTPACLTADL